MCVNRIKEGFKMNIELKIKQIKKRIIIKKNLASLAEKNFQGKVKLYSKAVGTEFHKKSYDLKEKARTSWWKELDQKIALEQELSGLVKQFVKSLEE
ncbi:hypothetical protein VP424E501_P0008 [Vibrio phage 424E50-1]|nr:hypothetical protein VP424E501_P0008 [Vibrio phage 424E50-1]